MQKKIIALAVAGLVSGAAFAQSNVSIYGIMDMGYRYNGSHVTKGVDGQNAMVSGDQSTSRIGFRGTEDLGNGLKAGFNLEYALAPDEGDTTVANMRTSVLNLSGKFGTFQMGRQLTPQNVIIGTVDPFATTGVGSTTNLYRLNNRLDNLFAYVSPSFGGLTVIAGYTWNGLAPESAQNNPAGATDAKVYAIAGLYNNGPLFIGANYHNIDVLSSTPAFGSLQETVWDLAAAYDFGIVKVSGAFGSRDPDSDNTAGGLSNDTHNWMLGLTAPVAGGTVLASYTRTSIDNVAGTSDAKAGQWAIGYTYPMSKRTNVYTKYAHVSGNNTYDAAGYGATGALTDRGNLGFDSAGHNAYQSGFSVGIRHSF